MSSLREWFLTGQSGDVRGREFLIISSEIKIGRTMENDIFVDDPNISRHHTLLFQKNGALWIRDLKSKNGTYVNGMKVPGDHVLSEGDTIRIAECQFKVGIEGGETKPRLKLNVSRKAMMYASSAILTLALVFFGLSINTKTTPTTAQASNESTSEGPSENFIEATDEEVLTWKSEAEVALRFEDFSAAVRVLRKVHQARPNDIAAKSLLKRSEAKLSDLIAHSYENGAQEYKKLYYDDAIREWQKAMALSEGVDPETYQRAQAKVLEAREKLEQIN